MSPPENASGPAGSEASTRESKLAGTVATDSASDKQAVDITGKSSRMPRNSALLFPNKAPRSGADWAHYRGVLRLLDGRFFWAGIWPRICNGRPVLELRLELKEDATKPLESSPGADKEFLKAFHAAAQGVLDNETFKALMELAGHSGGKGGG
jgi:hypothetical protein